MGSRNKSLYLSLINLIEYREFLPILVSFMKTSIKYLLFCIIYIAVQQIVIIILNTIIQNLKISFFITQIIFLITTYLFIKKKGFNIITIGINDINLKKAIVYCFSAIIFAIVLKLIFRIPIIFNFDKNIFRISTVVFISPILEEIIFRGLSLEWLKINNIDKNKRVCLTALIFGLIHLPINSLINYQIFLYGIISALIYEKERKLINCIIIHISFNLFMFFTE